MKKMNKIYEAPKAEMIEMMMPVVLTVSAPTIGGDPGSTTGGGSIGGGGLS
jgi:hypothetical protein